VWQNGSRPTVIKYKVVPWLFLAGDQEDPALLAGTITAGIYTNPTQMVYCHFCMAGMGQIGNAQIMDQVRIFARAEYCVELSDRVDLNGSNVPFQDPADQPTNPYESQVDMEDDTEEEMQKMYEMLKKQALKTPGSPRK
jgi:hypothetical protein